MLRAHSNDARRNWSRVNGLGSNDVFQSLLDESKSPLAPVWDRIRSIERVTQRRVLKAFQTARVGAHNLQGTTGYGYDDHSREKLESVYALSFQAERAIVRPQVASGTHALWICLDGLLDPGDEVISATGAPYDTLRSSIFGAFPHSLASKGVTFHEVALTDQDSIDFDGMERLVTPKTRMIYVQRSKGYTWRRATSINEIERIASWRRKHVPQAIILVDNCYGEFVEEAEPPAVGADLAVGSLIKNPGGTLAPSGGYIVGTKSLVERVADRVTAPGLGLRIGPTLGIARSVMQGLFMSPHLVSESLQGLTLAAWIFERAGLAALPRWNDARSDAVQAIRLGDPERLLAFCRSVQSSSPIDSDVYLESAPLPGYSDPVVMAAGTFVQGASSELTADGPMRDPFAAYMQGGISREQIGIALERLVFDLELFPR